MKKNITIKEFSKIYLKTLTSKYFRYINNADLENKRLKIFIPLYIAINKNIGNISDEYVLSSIHKYIIMLENGKFNSPMKKFMNSYKSYINMKTQYSELKTMLDEKIYELYVKKSITTYFLKKDLNINLKIANEIKNRKPISASITYKNKLINQLIKLK